MALSSSRMSGCMSQGTRLPPWGPYGGPGLARGPPGAEAFKAAGGRAGGDDHSLLRASPLSSPPQPRAGAPRSRALFPTWELPPRACGRPSWRSRSGQEDSMPSGAERPQRTLGVSVFMPHSNSLVRGRERETVSSLADGTCLRKEASCSALETLSRGPRGAVSGFANLPPSRFQPQVTYAFPKPTN